MIRILLADDHPVVRTAYQSLLSAQGAAYSFGEAGSGQAVLRALIAETWDLVLLDLTMPDHSGLRLLERIREEYAGTKVLVVSALPEELYATECLRLGACGFLAKSRAADQLPSAVIG